MEQILAVWDWGFGFFLPFHYILDGTALTDYHRSCCCFAKEAVFTHTYVCVCVHACVHTPL